MSPSSLEIRFTANTVILLAQLRALQGFFGAETALERQIELNALDALAEIKRMADAARRKLGIPTGYEATFCLEVSKHGEKMTRERIIKAMDEAREGARIVVSDR